MANSNSLTTILSDRKQTRLIAGDGTYDNLNPRQYNMAICATMLYGFLLNTATVYFFAEPLMQLMAQAKWWMLLLGYLVPTMAGIFIAARSQKPAVSLLGYTLVAIPIGILLALLLPLLPMQTVVKALTLTAMVCLTMLVLSTVAPQFFLGMGRTLFIALLAGLVIELVATFLLGYRGSAFDWFFVLIFSGYLGYDIARSQMYAKTLDNAIDCALDIYLDIINIFLRILSLLNRN